MVILSTLRRHPILTVGLATLFLLSGLYFPEVNYDTMSKLEACTILYGGAQCNALLTPTYGKEFAHERCETLRHFFQETSSGKYKLANMVTQTMDRYKENEMEAMRRLTKNMVETELLFCMDNITEWGWDE
jgi:hypothetical protein